jgi:exonuclease III
MSPLTQHLLVAFRTDTGRYPKRKLIVCHFTRCFRPFIENSFLPAGTAILSKYRPLNVNKTLPGHPDPGSVKGRIVTLEFENYYVIGTYVVNAGQDLKVCSSPKDAAPFHVMTSCVIDHGREENVESSF